MEVRAPAVVAVVVTTGSAPGLEAALSTLVGQDYEELSILVVANGVGEEVVSRVAAVAPNVFVKILDENRGFAAACNGAALMVSGAAFMLFCHDDVLFFEGSVRQMVEAAFRANAGIVSPKVVAYDDHFILLHVGQIADRFGTVRERVEIGEIDHGQQDLERDVFVAPGGVTLVRTDLFETLHGFDPLIPVLGEDLDICWRAQIAGARIIVAPGAVVAHRQTLATGERPITAVGTRNTSRMDLQRRHQLATVLTCWGPLILAQVIPAIILLDFAESVLALVGRDLDRFGSIAGAWRWVWRNRRHLRQRRKELAAIRVLKDVEIIRLQIGGASRVKTFVTTFFQDGLDRARGILPDESEEPEELSEADGIGFATAFLDDDTYEEIISTDHQDVRRRPSQLLTGARGQILVLTVALGVWFYGARNLIATPLPIIGRLAPLDSWWATWHHLFASWSPNGVGTGAPPMPGYGVLGLAGSFVFGRMGMLPRAALIFSVPFGAWGTWRLLRSVVSNRARVAATVAYLTFPIGANLIQRGRIDTLIIVAVLPFAARKVLILLNVSGFRLTPFNDPVHFGRRGWGRTRTGQIAILTMMVALMTAMAPAALVVVELLIVGFVVAQRVAGKSVGSLERPLQLVGRLAIGTAVLLAPMTIDTLSAGSRSLGLFGLTTGPWSGMGVSSLLRGANGPFGFGWGGWLVPFVALCALFLARDVRREYAVKLTFVLAMTVALALAVERHWLGSFAPDVDALLVLVGVCAALLVGVTVAAIENDLARAAFGWHQALAALSVFALVASFLPLFASATSGRFALPITGAPEALGTLAPSTLGGYRVLWLGDPSVLPVPGWSVAPGLSAATTTNSLPNGAGLFSPPNSGAADDLLAAVQLALQGRTVHLGQLLAPSGISAIVVMTAQAPSLSDVQSARTVAPPANLIDSLLRQSDLSIAPGQNGILLFNNSDFHGIVSERVAALSPQLSSSDHTSLDGWTPSLDFGYRSGPVTAGNLLAGVAPSSAFELLVDGHPARRTGAFGWAATYQVSAGQGRLVLHEFPFNGILASATLLAWLYLVSGFGALESFQRLTRRRGRGLKAAPAPVPSTTSENS